MHTPTATIERAFNLMVAAAIAGERCPANDVMGHNAASQLAHDKRIKVEVGGRNYRVVTIMTGEHAGKSTLRPEGFKPTVVIYGESSHRYRARSAASRAPSAPRTLSRDDINKL